MVLCHLAMHDERPVPVQQKLKDFPISLVAVKEAG